jgi:hypothetical protein
LAVSESNGTVFCLSPRNLGDDIGRGQLVDRGHEIVAASDPSVDQRGFPALGLTKYRDAESVLFELLDCLCDLVLGATINFREEFSNLPGAWDCAFSIQEQGRFHFKLRWGSSPDVSPAVGISREDSAMKS